MGVLEHIITSPTCPEVRDLHQDSKLCDKGLGGGNADLRPGTHKKGGIGNPAHGTAEYVCDGEGLAVVRLCLFERGECVCGLTRLRNPDHETVNRRREILKLR